MVSYFVSYIFQFGIYFIDFSNSLLHKNIIKTAYLRCFTQIGGLLFGGDEESRTPVRKSIPMNFYERILLLWQSQFHQNRANRRALKISMLQYTDGLQQLPESVHH